MAIVVKNLEMSFGELEVLKDISFSVARGEFVSVIGPSGCGKTTLLRCLTGLLTPTGGTVDYKDYLGFQSPRQMRTDRKLGMIFQKSALVPSLSAIDNVRLTQKIANDESGLHAGEILRRFGLLGFFSAYPHELSGGMKRRVDIAAGVAHDPPYIFMDEPFSSLDQFTREDLWDWLTQVLVHRTIVFVTHSIPEAVFLSDRVLALSRSGGIFLDMDVKLSRPRSPEMRRTERYTAGINTLRSLYE